MDEPLSNLDAKLRTIMRTEIQELQRTLDVTTVYVTHDQTEAMTMGDRIAIMDGGEIQQVATPLEAYYQPANRFVAGFIGSPSMNFFDVSIEGSGEGMELAHEGFTFDVTPTLRDELADYEDIILGIRPEDIHLAEEDDENIIEVEVGVVEPLGKDQLIHFNIGDETYKASVPGRLNIPEESMVHFSLPNEMIHLFDKKTGETIKNADAGMDTEQFEGNIMTERNIQTTESN